MSRYIDADALLERVMGNGLKPITEQIFRKLINDAPTIDAVSVVRCKDCRYCQYKQIHDLYRCIKPNIEHWMYNADIHYCDYGERKGE